MACQAQDVSPGLTRTRNKAQSRRFIKGPYGSDSSFENPWCSGREVALTSLIPSHAKDVFPRSMNKERGVVHDFRNVVLPAK